MEFEYLLEGAFRSVRLEKKDGGYAVRAGSDGFEVGIAALSEHEIILFQGRRAVPAYVAREGERLHVYLGGRAYVLSPPARERASGRSDDASEEESRLIKAPMPGKVIKILVGEGQAVRRNQALAIVEAMKMENEIKAPVEGVVGKIHVGAGDLVDARKILLELEPKI